MNKYWEVYYWEPNMYKAQSSDTKQELMRICWIEIRYNFALVPSAPLKYCILKALLWDHGVNSYFHFKTGV